MFTNPTFIPDSSKHLRNVVKDMCALTLVTCLQVWHSEHLERPSRSTSAVGGCHKWKGIVWIVWVVWQPSKQNITKPSNFERNAADVLEIALIAVMNYLPGWTIETLRFQSTTSKHTSRISENDRWRRLSTKILYIIKTYKNMIKRRTNPVHAPCLSHWCKCKQMTQNTREQG